MSANGFDYPAEVRAALEDPARTGHPPWGLINHARFIEGAKIRRAGGVAPGSFHGLAADSLVQVPRDAAFLALSGRAKDFAHLVEFAALEALQLYDRVGEPELDVIGRMKSLRLLSIPYVKGAHLDALSRLARLQHLQVSDAPKLTRLDALEGLRDLRTLTLEHLPSLKQLAPVGALTQLHGLVLSGSMWTAMRVKSLRPLTALRRLEQLSLVNVRVADGSLAPLAELPALRQLGVPNWFTVDEFAALAAARPDIEGRFHSPWFVEPRPVDEPTVSTCKRCKRYALGMTLGKPSKQLCPDCDRAKVAKVTARWDALVAAARP